MLLNKKPCPYAYCTAVLLIVFLVYNIALIDRSPADTIRRIRTAITSLASRPAYLSFPAPSPTRTSDLTDVFAGYRHQDICHISSLDLRVPFEPACADMPSLLRAMAWGGRPGFNAPYIPFGCDMRFYSSAEMCEILGRFSGLVLMGDSIIRHVTNAFWVMMRGDMGYGAIRGWSIPHRTNNTEDCACRAQIEDPMCNTIGFHQRDWRDRQAGEEDLRHVCGADFPLKLTYQSMLDWPQDPAHFKSLLSLMPAERPAKPIALVLGHALWNNVDLNKTELWMDEVLDALEQRSYSSALPKLFLSTNAGGQGKPSKWLQTQSVQKMADFEKGVQPLAEARDMDFLGMYNMSVQATTIDGTHAGL